ncbi:BAT1-like protein [Mya arenaria]|uniref:BAT1-like protein n=1 Tax=Mya arenaria TaxID=6604 RepID=A0ABY7DV08_MYAAR|nr:b(0,+)-type amino acid transporter 1-like [Mya arenaria]WAR00516.1 BAT1-like protein [Mya arenaria]
MENKAGFHQANAPVKSGFYSSKTTESDAKTTIEVEVVNPQQHIGLFGAVTFGVGSMIGSGIFISPKGALDHTGSPGASLLVWVLCGILSMCMGLVYAELGTLIPRSGGDFTYIRKAFGQWPSFLAVWVVPLFSQATSSSVLALVFADYFLPLIIPSCSANGVIRKLIASIHILSIGVSNVFSPRLGVFIQIASTIAKTAALILIAITGIVALGKGSTDNLSSPFQDTTSDVTSYSLAIYACLFAYSGYVRIGEIAEEIKEPKKNIPRAIIISIIVVTSFYILVNISYFVFLPKTEFLGSSAVAYSWALKALPSVAIFVPIGVMISVYGANNGGCFGAARVMFAAARAGLYPEVLSNLHTEKSTPIISLLLYHGFALAMLVPGEVGSLINFTSFLTSFILLLSSLSLLRLKYLLRDTKRDTFYVPFVLPIFTSLVNIFLIVAPFISSPRIEFVYGAVFAFGGYILYIPFVHFGLKLPGTDKVTMGLQLLCNVCPTEKID